MHGSEVDSLDMIPVVAGVKAVLTINDIIHSSLISAKIPSHLMESGQMVLQLSQGSIHSLLLGMGMTCNVDV